MTPERRIRLVAYVAAAALHVAVAAALLIQMTAGAPPSDPLRQGHPSVISVSLIPSDAPTAPPVALSAPRGPARPHANTADPFAPPAAAPAGGDAGPGARQGPGPGSQATPLQAASAPMMTEAAVLSYRQQIQAYLARYLRYPLEARRAGVQGTVSLHFVLTRDGQVSDAWIVSSSGSAALDGEALQVIQRAAPLPAIPTGWPGPLDVTLPVAFALS